MTPLGYAVVLVGALVLISGLTGSTFASVAQGKPDRVKAGPAAPAANIAAPSSQAAPAGPGSPVPSSGSWRAVQSALAHEHGWSIADWNSVIQRESGGDPNSRNASSGAYGIGQFLPSNFGAYPGAGSSNPVLQIRAMAKYIAERYGTPSAALAHERTYGWY